MGSHIFAACPYSRVGRNDHFPYAHTHAWLEKIILSPPTGGRMYSSHLLYKMAIHITVDVPSTVKPASELVMESDSRHLATRVHICTV